MTLSFLQRRMKRILTRLPEFLYALTRHWFLVVFCLLIGTSSMWCVLVTQPVTYEARAQLLVNRNDSILSTLSGAGQSGPLRGGDIGAFLNSQTAILQSDSVVRKIILCTGFSGASNPVGAKPHGDGESESVQDQIDSVVQELSKFLLLQQPMLEASSEEKAMLSAIERFKERSEVIPNLRENTIDLLVYGTSHDAMKQDLQCWIEAYKSRLAAMEKETWEDFLAERGRKYASRKETVYQDVQMFNEANPNVAESRREFLFEQIVQIRFELNSLRQRMIISLPTPAALRVNPEYTRLVAEKNGLEMKLVQLKEAGFSENSTPVRPLKRQLNLAIGKLSNLEMPTSVETSDPELDRIFDSRVAILEGELKALYAERSRVSEKLKEYEDLEERYKDASENFDRFELVKLEALQLLESPLNVQVSDEPAVDPRPVGLPALLKLSLGSLAGLFAGMGLAIILEVLCGKIRFKHDLIDDFGLPVVAVLPR